MNKSSVFPLTLEKICCIHANYTQLYIIIIVVQFYPWIILVSFVSYSLSYIFIPKKKTGKNLNWSKKQKNKNTVHVWPKEKNDNWLTQSCTGWLFLLERFELSVGYSLLPHQLQVHTPPPSGMPFNINIIIKEDHCQPY